MYGNCKQDFGTYPCADLESFVRGGPALFFFSFRRYSCARRSFQHLAEAIYSKQIKELNENQKNKEW